MNKVTSLGKTRWWILAVIVVAPVLALAGLGGKTIADRLKLRYGTPSIPIDAPGVVETSYYRLGARRLALPGPRWGGSGAIAVLGDDVFFVARTGEFFRVASSSDEFTALDAKAPFSHAELVQNQSRPEHEFTYGVKDVLISSSGDSTIVLLTHHFWDAPRQCYLLRLSRFAASSGVSEQTAWGCVPRLVEFRVVPV